MRTARTPFSKRAVMPFRSAFSGSCTEHRVGESGTSRLLCGMAATRPNLVDASQRGPIALMAGQNMEAGNEHDAARE